VSVRICPHCGGEIWEEDNAFYDAPEWNALTKTEQDARIRAVMAFHDEQLPKVYEMRDRLVIQEKADIARELAAAERDAEVEAKAQTLDDAEKFWAYIATNRPGYAYKTCAVIEWRERRKRDQWALF